MDNNGKELPPKRALCRYRALSKCQFGDTVDEAAVRVDKSLSVQYLLKVF